MFITKNNKFARASRFLYIFSLSLHDYDVKMPNFTFLGERIKTSDDEFFFLFLNLSAVRTKSAPEKFAYI